MLVLIAEVHPFTDGNGRISRLGMNAELEHADCARLILPTAFRSDYLSVLEALTTNRNPEPYVTFCHRLIELNSRMVFTTFAAAHEHFRQTGALNDTLNNFGLLPLLQGTPPTAAGS
jgi:Fic family protein